jgi:hypothetical protein
MAELVFCEPVQSFNAAVMVDKLGFLGILILDNKSIKISRINLISFTLMYV